MSVASKRVAHLGTTIFTEMTALAQHHHAVNLGQGFPDFPAPDFLKEAAQAAIADDVNQYAPLHGLPALRQAIARKMSRFYGLVVDPDVEVTVTHGATEAIFSAIMGLVDPGDEVILFEPYYDSYVPAVEFAGGIPRYLTLRPPSWQIDPDELASLFSQRTKLLVLNTPHNPTGKVFSYEELQLIADLCQQYEVMALADEVYEHILFDDRQHIPLATLPGMAERTVTISSLGKSYSVTGWKVGWAIAAAPQTRALRGIHQFATFSGAAPLQAAAAVALAAEDAYYTDLAASYQARRDFLLKALRDAGLDPVKPAGTYFIMVRLDKAGFKNDVAFCHYLTKEVGVAAIPPSVFYHNPADGARLARFAFCKSEPLLEEAARRLRRLVRTPQ